ncbi:MAG: radical SAM protein, partial [Draconibacterium sp.]|nr:radical SAM protein [Draconibacterium sp.]
TTKLVYNTLSGALIEHKTGNLIGGNHNDELVKNGFLVEEGVDESLILQRENMLVRDSRVLQLSIATTLDCNFSCDYCYETRTKEKMSHKTLKSVITFIKNTIKENNLNKGHIYWMGGEPLLNREPIFKVIKELQEMISIEGIIYTNGYLLSKSFIDSLDYLKIQTVYLTIDGFGYAHDKKRNINGKPTYNKIKNNIEYLVNKWEGKVKIVIRTNIDSDNLNTYKELLEDFKDLRGKVRFTGGPKIHSDNKEIFENFEKYEAKIADDIFIRGFGKVKLPARLSYACPAYSRYSFGINTKGEVFRCIEGLGTDTSPIGKISDDGKFLINSEEYKNWDSFDVFSDQECKECKFLPICFGGCLAVRIKSSHSSKYVDSSKACIVRDRELFNERIKRYYYENK